MQVFLNNAVKIGTLNVMEFAKLPVASYHIANYYPFLNYQFFN